MPETKVEGIQRVQGILLTIPSEEVIVLRVKFKGVIPQNIDVIVLGSGIITIRKLGCIMPTEVIVTNGEHLLKLTEELTAIIVIQPLIFTVTGLGNITGVYGEQRLFRVFNALCSLLPSLIFSPVEALLVSSLNELKASSNVSIVNNSKIEDFTGVSIITMAANTVFPLTSIKGIFQYHLVGSDPDSAGSAPTVPLVELNELRDVLRVAGIIIRNGVNPGPCGSALLAVLQILIIVSNGHPVEAP